MLDRCSDNTGLPDTSYVVAYMLSENYLVALNPRIDDLPSLDVLEMGKYREDSIKTREEYAGSA